MFHFKHFSVRNDLSSMKVNTDGVLLGAVAPIGEGDARVLDIGTGTGTVALMLSQRSSSAEIVGIDIDAPSAAEASENFAASPWADRLQARHQSLQELDSAEKWDLIVTNPPYYDNSLPSPQAGRNVSRHSGAGESMSFREVVVFASKALVPTGRLAIILPSDRETALLRYAASFSLFPSSIIYFRTTASKAPSRFIAVLRRKRSEAVEKHTLTIRSGGSYTAEYLELVKDFYLFV